jgi:hypothetical protein
MHWLGPYEVKYVTDDKDVQLKYLAGKQQRNDQWEPIEVV